VRGTQKWVDVEHHATTTEALAALKAEGYRIVATTPHRCSATPETFDVTRGKFALVFGTEHAGISDEVIEAADDFLMIPMCGMVESLNVSASAAILIYMLAERVRQTVDGWQLSDEEQLRLLTRWTMSSVRDYESILRRAEQSGQLSMEY
jgi:tRNA (guanosine-2'-O-)-methyltransferase